ncbi:MAG: 30S ribosomal protein S3 [Candidatus Nomurabacteria bacterium]|nr:MAG: 30S ribosomal protein S3 [Candidatus Nomurabacteria bacterium]
MGQKVHPIGFRLGINRNWNSRWFSARAYREYLKQDVNIRKHITNKLKNSGISRIDIERSSGSMTVTIHTSKPGLVIGRGGAASEELRVEIRRKFIRDPKLQLKLSIQEITRPEVDANIVVQNVIEQLEKRMPFRRVLKTTIESVKRAGAEGVKVMVAGRLNGAEIARTEYLTWGKLPLQTIRANIDYSRGVARTIYGAIGVKVWIYKGEVFAKEQGNTEEEPLGTVL